MTDKRAREVILIVVDDVDLDWIEPICYGKTVNTCCLLIVLHAAILMACLSNDADQKFTLRSQSTMSPNNQNWQPFSPIFQAISLSLSVRCALIWSSMQLSWLLALLLNDSDQKFTLRNLSPNHQNWQAFSPIISSYPSHRCCFDCSSCAALMCWNALWLNTANNFCGRQHEYKSGGHHDMGVCMMCLYRPISFLVISRETSNCR